MKSLVLQFRKEKETKGTYRYQELEGSSGDSARSTCERVHSETRPQSGSRSPSRLHQRDRRPTRASCADRPGPAFAIAAEKTRWREALHSHQVVVTRPCWGGRTPKAGGRDLDGRTWDDMPAARHQPPAMRA